MAIGVRIISDDLSGQTANVTYLPDTGGTIDLGSQVFPFNYISNYYYGTYNCYVPLYGYTYSLNVPGPTPSPTPTLTQTPTNTPGLSPSPTNTETATPTTTATPTVTPTNTSTPTPSVTIGLTPTATASNTPTPSITPSITPTNTETPTNTPTNTETPTVTPSVTATPSVTPSVTTTSTTTPTVTPTQTITPSNSLCKTYLLFGGTINQTSFVGTDCDGFPIDLFLDVLETLIVCGRNIVVADGDGSVTYLGGCPLPTPTATPTNTTTPTNTPSNTASNTPTPSVTSTVTPTVTNTPTNTASNTPTPSVTETTTPTTTNTPSVSPTQTQTPTVTPTVTVGLTPTPTPTHARIAFTSYSGLTQLDACNQVNSPITIYGNNPQFDLNGEFWNTPVGNSTIDLAGYYQTGNYVVQLDAFGFTVGFGELCPSPTPTTTNTQTPTPSLTPTNTATQTSTPTNTPTVTPTSTISNVILYVGNNDSSNGSQISGITINSVLVTNVSPPDFPVPYIPVGNSIFSTTQFGGTYTVEVGVTTTNVAFNNVRVQDSNLNQTVYGISALTATYTFTNVFINATTPIVVAID